MYHNSKSYNSGAKRKRTDSGQERYKRQRQTQEYFPDQGGQQLFPSQYRGKQVPFASESRRDYAPLPKQGGSESSLHTMRNIASGFKKLIDTKDFSNHTGFTDLLETINRLLKNAIIF